MDLTDFIVIKNRRLYRVTCKTCGTNRGYQRKREADKNCKSCDSSLKGSGRIHSEESRIKRSAWNQGINVSDFKDFLTTKDERDRLNATKLNKSVFERDDFTCNCCAARGGKLNAHHLESFANCVELRLNKDNIVTLCESCHIDFHDKYGRKNNTKQQYLEYKENYEYKQMDV